LLAKVTRGLFGSDGNAKDKHSTTPSAGATTSTLGGGSQRSWDQQPNEASDSDSGLPRRRAALVRMPNATPQPIDFGPGVSLSVPTATLVSEGSGRTCPNCGERVKYGHLSLSLFIYIYIYHLFF
jgi:hypothetical protein